ncbi:putative leader peptide [Streptomyces murinus]|uniref:putative leader peptide n=1 Tax=Streptomyces murinus TaxID=33900 RepID=UPI003990B276
MRAGLVGAGAVRGVEVLRLSSGALSRAGPRRVAVVQGTWLGARIGGTPGACTAPEPHTLPLPSRPLTPPRAVTLRPHRDRLLTAFSPACCTPVVTDTCVRLWRRVHMDLVRYPGCVCRPSC